LFPHTKGKHRLRGFENRVLRRIFGLKREEVAGGGRFITCTLHHILFFLLLLTLAPQPNLGLGLLHKIRLNFLEASQQFSIYRVRLLAPRPTPILEVG
jgi:hypothetical protein